MTAWNVPFAAPPTGFNFLGSGGAGLASGFTGGAAGAGAAGTAAAGAGAAAGAAGPLAALGGPAGLGIMAGTSLLGGIMAGQQAEASLQAAKEQAKLGAVFNLAGNRFLQRTGYGDQLSAFRDRSLARQAGYSRPDDFAGLLQAGMSPSAAKRELYGPIFRG